MHISTNDLHCYKPARLLQLAPSRGRPHRLPLATAPPCITPPHWDRGVFKISRSCLSIDIDRVRDTADKGICLKAAARLTAVCAVSLCAAVSLCETQTAEAGTPVLLTQTPLVLVRAEAGAPTLLTQSPLILVRAEAVSIESWVTLRTVILPLEMSPVSLSKPTWCNFAKNFTTRACLFCNFKIHQLLLPHPARA